MEEIVLTIDALNQEIKKGKKLILLEPFYDNKFNVLIGTEKVLTEKDIQRILERSPDHAHKRLKVRTTIPHYIEEDKRIKWAAYIISLFEGSDLFRPVNRDIKEFIVKYLQTSLSESDYIIWKISQIKTLSKRVFDHSINTCFISLIIYYVYSVTKQSGMINARMIENIIEAALLHYVGLVSLFKDNAGVLEKKRHELLDAQKEVLSQYPIESFKLIKNENSKHELSHEALEAILCCEEFLDGSGCPRGMKEGDLSLISKILSLSNFFELLISGELSPKQRPYREYIAKLLVEKEKFDPGLLESLSSGFKYFYQL